MAARGHKSLWSKFQSSFRESLKQIGPNLAGMFLCMVCPSGVTFVPISHPTWLPKADWYFTITLYYINKYIQKVTTLGYQLAMMGHTIL
jgi:hypothetical protein